MLDDEVLDVVFFEVLLQQVVAGAKIVFQSQGIDHSYNTIESGIAFGRHLGSHLRDRADGLSNGRGLAYAAGFDDNIVEAVLADNVL